MLSYEDIIAFCGLTEEEVEAIAEHEHIPEVAAAEMGQYLIECEDGIPRLKKIILDDIRDAEARGDMKHALDLRMVLRHFIRAHRPDAGSTAA